jgi:predicted MFS family arabinose efflux permease
LNMMGAFKGQAFLLGCAAFLSMASMRVCDPLLPALARAFSVDIGHAAATISFFVVAYGLLQLVYGPLGDRWGKLRIVSFCVCVCAIANIGAAVAPTLPLIIAARAVSGAAAAGIIPVSLAYLGDTTPYEQRQEALAKYLFATISGMITSQWVSGLAADIWNWRAVFYALSLGFAVTGGLLGWSSRMQAAAGAHTTYLSQLRLVITRPWPLTILLVTMMEGCFTLSAFAFVPAYLNKAYGLSLTVSGGIMALYGAGGLVYVFLAKRLLSRLGEIGLAILGGCVLGVAFAMLAFAPHWAWSVPACFLGGLGFYMLHNTLQTNATQMVPEARGTAVALFASSLFLGQAVGMVAASRVVDQLGEQPVFLAGMVMLPLIATAFQAKLKQRHTRLRIPSCA